MYLFIYNLCIDLFSYLFIYAFIYLFSYLFIYYVFNLLRLLSQALYN
jgi:hypothetical protein